jgi:hypothetical protein
VHPHISSQYIAYSKHLQFPAGSEPFKFAASNVLSFVSSKRAHGNMTTAPFTAHILRKPVPERAVDASLMARRLHDKRHDLPAATQLLLAAAAAPRTGIVSHSRMV